MRMKSYFYYELMTKTMVIKIEQPKFVCKHLEYLSDSIYSVYKYFYSKYKIHIKFAFL